RSGLPLTSAGPVDVACGKASVIRGQLDVYRGKLSRLTRSAERRGAAEVLIFLLRRASTDLQRRPDRARCHTVDTDTPAGKLLGQRFHVVHRRGFRLRVVIKIR